MNLFSRSAAVALALGLISSITGCSSDPASTNDPGNTDTTSTVRVVDNVKISAQASTYVGNYYDVEKDSSYAMSKYSSKKTEIDFVYYYGSSSGGDLAAIVSPDNDILSKGSISGNYSGYATDAARVGANHTEFRKLATFTAAQFDALKDSASITAAFAGGGTSADKAVELATGNVVAFKTASGTVGLFKVKDISSESAAGYITLTVKRGK
jgi:hypothetical protein